MSLLSTTTAHISVFLALSSFVTGLPLSSVVTGLPSSTLNITIWDCPDNCHDEPDHPGCINATMICARLDKIKENQKDLEVLVETLKQDSEKSAYSLLIMGTALSALVPILLLGLALIILKLYLPSFFKCLKKRSNPERRPTSTQNIWKTPSNTQNLSQLSVSTIKLSNHQPCSESPQPTLNRISKHIPPSTHIAEGYRQQVAQPKQLRRQPSESTCYSTTATTQLRRQPSESTCPDESSDNHQGNDNLGLSNSTLHNQSTTSSNRTLSGTNNSTRTLNTTLQSNSSSNQSFSTRI